MRVYCIGATFYPCRGTVSSVIVIKLSGERTVDEKSPLAVLKTAGSFTKKYITINMLVIYGETLFPSKDLE